MFVLDHHPGDTDVSTVVMPQRTSLDCLTGGKTRTARARGNVTEIEWEGMLIRNSEYVHKGANVSVCCEGKL